MLALLSFGCAPKPPRHALLDEPKLLIQEHRALLEMGPVFAAPETIEALRRGGADFLQGPSAPADSVRRALVDPAHWRELDRGERYVAAVVSGDLAASGPWLRHLLDAGDWSPVHADAWGVLLARRSEADLRGCVDRLNAALESVPANARAAVEARAAQKLQAIRREDLALPLADAAAARDPKNAEAAVVAGSLKLSSGKKEEALEAAERALNLQRNFAPAHDLKAQALFALQRYGEAYSASKAALALGEPSPARWLAHARICHGAHAYGDEVAALRRVVAAHEAAGLPDDAYRIYLGQALSADGRAAEALAEFRKARDGKRLDAGQSAFVERAITRLEQGLQAADEVR